MYVTSNISVKVETAESQTKTSGLLDRDKTHFNLVVDRVFTETAVHQQLGYFIKAWFLSPCLNTDADWIHAQFKYQLISITPPNMSFWMDVGWNVYYYLSSATALMKSLDVYMRPAGSKDKDFESPRPIWDRYFAKPALRQVSKVRPVSRLTALRNIDGMIRGRFSTFVNTTKTPCCLKLFT